MLHQSRTDQTGDRGFVGDVAGRNLTDYIRARIAGVGTDLDFLEAMTFDEAMDTCTLIGAIDIAGLEYGKALVRSDQCSWRATAAGFAIASAGEALVESFLTQCIKAADFPLGYGLACMGSLHRRLSTFEPDGRLVELKRIAIRVGYTTGMIHYATTEVYGMPVPPARFVGVKHAAVMFKCNRRRLRSILIDMGHIDPNSTELPETKVVIDLEALAPVLSEISGALTLTEAGKIIGVHPNLLSQMVDMGSLPALYQYDRTDKMSLRHIATKTMVNYVDGVLAQVTPLPVELESVDTICTLDEIPGRIIKPRHLVLDLIARKQLKRVYTRTANPTLKDILVDTEEVVRFYDERADDELDVFQTCELLGASPSSVQYLSLNRHLPFHIRPNPVNGRKQRTWSRQDVLAFEATYVSLGRLGWAIDRQCNFVTKRLKTDGILPVITNAKMHMYRREDVRNCTTKSIAAAYDCGVAPKYRKAWITAMWEKRRAAKKLAEDSTLV